MRILFFLQLFVLLLFSSCSSYINKIYKDLDRQEAKNRVVKQRDQFAMYRKPHQFTTQRPATSNRVSSKNSRNLMPQTRRQYSRPAMKKRMTADDLNDNSQSGSLWTGSGKDSHLFTQSKNRKIGDIILIQVQSHLKNEITLELKREFARPVLKKKSDKGGEKKEGDAAEGGDATKKTPASTAGADSGGDAKIYDRISSIIIEEINQDHLLLKGRKDVLFNNRKHTVEIQGLVKRNHILTDDTVDSDNFLETTINILR